jgi:hypothetical protein
MPPGQSDCVCRRAGRQGMAGWQREDGVTAMVGAGAIGKLARGGNLRVVYGEAGH